MTTNDMVARLLTLTEELRSIRTEDLNVALKMLDGTSLDALRLASATLAFAVAHEVRSRAVDQGHV